MSRPLSRSPRLGVLIMPVLVLAACGMQTPPSEGAIAVETDGRDGSPDVPRGADGVLSVAWEGDIASLDPSQGYDFISWAAERLIFETLVTYDQAELVPWLVETMPEVSEDGTVYTFRLRERVTFANPDGTVHRETTADDVVHSINRVLDPNLRPAPSPVAGAFFAMIKGGQAVVDGEATEAAGIVALDERTVEFTLEFADPTFLNVMAMPFASIVPADLAGQDTEAFADTPVGTGPYLLESYTVGDRATFTLNPHYWGEPPANGGVELRFGVDANTAVQQVEVDQLDIMGDPIPSGVVTSLRRNPDYADRISIAPQIAVNYMSIDTSPPEGGPLADVRVRQAMNHAIDKENIVRLIRGRGTVAHCIFPVGMPGHNADCRPYNYDTGMAEGLLEDAGIADGFSTTLYTDTSDDSTAVAQAIQQDLGAIGIEVEIVTHEFDVLLGTITTPHAAPLVYIGWSQDFPDPSAFYDPILSCAAAVHGGANTSWYCDEENDGLAAEARVNLDAEARLAAYQELELLVMQDAPWVPLFFPAIDTFLSSRVTNFEPHPVWFLDLASYGVEE